MPTPARIAMALVYPSLDGRAVIKPAVARLVESISAIGLQSPITVRPSLQFANGREIDAYQIVAGRHRYEAARALGWDEIDAFVMEATDDDAELWEIDENFARADLTDAQRADHHVRREAILVRKGLVSVGSRGGDRRSNDKLSYGTQTAAALGVDKRTVQRDLARGKNISPEILAEVTGTDLDKGVVLDELARTPQAAQTKKLIEIRERQDAEKLNRYADKQVARSNARVAAEIVFANLDLDQIDALRAALSPTSMKDFLAELGALAAGSARAA